MKGRTCLVTGATHGIGFATARGLARAGATVVVHGCSAARVETVVGTIRRATGNPAVSGLVADFSSLGDQRQLFWQVDDDEVGRLVGGEMCV